MSELDREQFPWEKDLIPDLPLSKIKKYSSLLKQMLQPQPGINTRLRVRRPLRVHPPGVIHKSR